MAMLICGNLWTENAFCIFYMKINAEYIWCRIALFLGIGWSVASPADAAVLRIGLLPSAMPLQSDTRNYTDAGFEGVLARELAQQLGQSLELVSVAAEHRQQALQYGEVDALLLPAGDGLPAVPATTLLPAGHDSGYSVAMRSDTTVRTWSDLRGRTVCVAQGHRHWQDAIAALGAQVRWFDAPAQALVLVRTGECDAALGEQAQLQQLFRRKEWQKFSATLPPRSPAKWVLAVGASNRDLQQQIAPVWAQLAQPARWQQRLHQWAADVAFEVYFDQIGPDCH